MRLVAVPATGCDGCACRRRRARGAGGRASSSARSAAPRWPCARPTGRSRRCCRAGQRRRRGDRPDRIWIRTRSPRSAAAADIWRPSSWSEPRSARGRTRSRSCASSSSIVGQASLPALVMGSLRARPMMTGRQAPGVKSVVKVGALAGESRGRRRPADRPCRCRWFRDKGAPPLGYPPTMSRLLRPLLRSRDRFQEDPSSIGNAVRVVMAVVVAAVLVGSAVIWLFDKRDFPDYGSALWFSLQTVTTVGYGDLTPTIAPWSGRGWAGDDLRHRLRHGHHGGHHLLVRGIRRAASAMRKPATRPRPPMPISPHRWTRSGGVSQRIERHLGVEDEPSDDQPG